MFFLGNSHYVAKAAGAKIVPIQGFIIHLHQAIAIITYLAFKVIFPSWPFPCIKFVLITAYKIQESMK